MKEEPCRVGPSRAQNYMRNLAYLSPKNFSPLTAWIQQRPCRYQGRNDMVNEGHGYNIEVSFVGGLTPGQQAAFKSAADRWSLIITADGPAAANPTPPEWTL